MYQSITLNIHYTLPEVYWQKLQAVYPTMPGWIGYGTDGCPYWYSKGREGPYLVASVEPSGLLIDGHMETAAFNAWIEAFKIKATEALGFEVMDAEE